MQRGTPARPPLLCGGDAGGVGGGDLRRHRRARRAATARHCTGSAIWSTSPRSTRSMYSQPLYPVTWFQVAGEPFRPLRSSQLPSVHPTADGWVSLQTTTGQQWLDFCVMVGRDDWLVDEQMARGTLPHVAPRRDRAGDRRVDLGARRPPRSSSSPPRMRIPVAEVGNGANLPHFDHLVDGGWFTTNAHGFTQPSVPYRLGGGATPRPFGVAPAIGRDTERAPRRVDAAPPRDAERAERRRRAAAARGDPRARPHRVLGGPAHRARVRHPRRRGDPRRVHQAARRHPLQHHAAR